MINYIKFKSLPREDRQLEQAKLDEQQQYENLQNTLLDAANKFNEIVLDVDDPKSDALEIEESDKQMMLDYLLTPDKDGQSRFDKDLLDSAALIELAYLKNNNLFDFSISNYWKIELLKVKEELLEITQKLKNIYNAFEKV